MKIKDYVNGHFTYDKFGGQYIWLVDKTGGHQLFADMRGWGAIQNLFKGKGGSIDMDAAGKFQDELGEWAAQALNDKLKSENKDSLEDVFRMFIRTEQLTAKWEQFIKNNPLPDQTNVVDENIQK